MAEKVLNPFQFVVIVLAGWMSQRQQNVIEYLREENRVLREQLGERRLRFTDDQRRRLAVRAKGLGRKLLAQVATLPRMTWRPCWFAWPKRITIGYRRIEGAVAIWEMNMPTARSLLFFRGTASNQRPTEIEKQLGKSSREIIGK